MLNLQPALASLRDDPKLIPMYQRGAMKGTKAPMHTVKRFVAKNLLPLQ